MQEQLIKLETAILAKEKGFDIKTTQFYSSNYGLCKEYEELLVYQGGVLLNDCDSNIDLGEIYYASTQSLLQKWLRDIHNIHLVIIPEEDDNYQRIWVARFSDLTDKVMYLKYLTIEPTYEEALEEGIYKALKLIK